MTDKRNRQVLNTNMKKHIKNLQRSFTAINTTINTTCPGTITDTHCVLLKVLTLKKKIRVFP